MSWTPRLSLFPLLAGVILAALPGCKDRPRAPALQNEPIYESKQEGFRFLAPEGWRVIARGEPPRGKQEKDRLLIEYQRVRAGKQASLIVTMADLPGAASLSDCLARQAVNDADWKASGAVEELDVGGLNGARATYDSRFPGEKTIMETVAVRRGDRVYFFSGVFVASDKRAREQIRKAVASVSW